MPIRILVTVMLAALLAGCPPPRGVYHTVREGQNLYRIGKAYGVDEARLARINDISDPALLRVGQRLFIPGADRPLSVPATVRPAPAPPASAETDPPPPRKSPPPAPAPATVRKPAPKPQPSPSAAPVKVKFAWPVQGKLLKKFSGKSASPSKGIEIAARRGTPVLSSAAGKVIYSGNGISGFGNLIILRHDAAYYTVYGYNEKNLVSEGAFVSKGERIALCGAPPQGGEPRLHFEIRQGKKAVDPIFYLP